MSKSITVLLGEINPLTCQQGGPELHLCFQRWLLWAITSLWSQDSIAKLLALKQNRGSVVLGFPCKQQLGERGYLTYLIFIPGTMFYLSGCFTGLLWGKQKPRSWEERD